MGSTKRIKLNTKNLSGNEKNSHDLNGFNVEIFHLSCDPPMANRLKISNSNTELELLPSKGLSLGQAWIDGKTVFWDPADSLPNPDNLDLWSDEIYINGKPTPGFTYLKTFMGGVEFYGLKNWGMPTVKDGILQPLHGETSNIPIDEVEISSDGNICCVEATFIYRSFEGDVSLPWYQRGHALFKVTKRIKLSGNSMNFRIEDSIENISDVDQFPDWGYHITFRPENGAMYLVPSRIKHERNNDSLPDHFDTWHPAINEKERKETGIVYKCLDSWQSRDGLKFVTSLLTYPDNSGVAVTVPESPYFQTWFCSGGKDSKEFTYKDGKSLINRNWDGLGIEIGSSSLDHNDIVDESVNYNPLLKPGEMIKLHLHFQSTDSDQTSSIVELMKKYKL